MNNREKFLENLMKEEQHFKSLMFKEGKEIIYDSAEKILFYRRILGYFESHIWNEVIIFDDAQLEKAVKEFEDCFILMGYDLYLKSAYGIIREEEVEGLLNFFKTLYLS